MTIFRPIHILPIVFLAFLSGAVVVVKAHRAPRQAAWADEQAAPIGVLQSAPSLSAAQIDAILASYGSPAQGSGKDFYDLGVEWGIDPAYALAFFVEESSAGTDPRWDGIKPDGTTTHDIGNISCGGGFACYGRWRDYPDWRTGIEDWYRLIRNEYIIGRGHQTVDDVIPVYAPAFENDVGGYTNTVNALVGKWREETQRGEGAPPSVSLPNNAYTAPPLQVAGAGCLEPNVTSAYEHSPGLQQVTIAPGQDWSFNEQWQIAPDQTACPGQNFVGGGVCNMASRYSNVARALGLQVQSQYHGYVYDGAVPEEDNLAIMSSGGRGGQDLVIVNTSPQTVVMTAVLDGNQLIVSGGFTQ